MAYNSTVAESHPLGRIAAKIDEKEFDSRGYSTFISQDSGYNESLKVFSPDHVESSRESFGKLTITKDYDNSENIEPSLTPITNVKCWTHLAAMKESRQSVTVICETPRFSKKDVSLRRRLLLSKATPGGTIDFDASECSAEISGSSKSPLCISRFDVGLSNSFVDSPRESTYEPIATSTLKNAESASSCKKWRLSFAQQRSSTLDDSKSDDNFTEVENISPVQHSNSATDDSMLSIHEAHLSELPGTPACSLIARPAEEFQTPISNLAANFNFNLCTPTVEQISDLDCSITEDSAFHSLSWDKSQDSITDHEGSFQELIQKPRETPKAVHSKNRLRKLDRCRRLSTLRERGSQSEVEEENTETHLLTSAYKSKVARESVNEESELCIDDSNENSILNIADLTGTPALRVVHDMLMRSSKKRQQATVQDITGHTDGFDHSEDDVLTKLIGRKMGLEKLDILAELNCRNLKHLLAFIFRVLDMESICSIWKVSKQWREIVIQDKITYQRRKVFLRKLKTEAEQGRHLSSEDAATRLNLLTRSALKSVQSQARTAYQTPSSLKSSQTPKDSKSIRQSASKQQEYVKIAKTLFTDEALKPCPQCQYPAKFQPLKKRGKCSRKDCGFDFCILCLCTFHGSEECSTGSTKRKNKKDALPGSAQSKRNLKRL
ncbi:F-box only protein 43 [Bombina bombina]|uniref:F-box only protein 43 n=1 Tax=Bombina bombina TaxID=8345 RepID=UPI00235A7CA2|nr:F-box only protein 43 [Bombina bombina]